MQDSDLPRFESALNRLCAGFDTPPTVARKEAYWRSFRKLPLLEFAGLIDLALVESTFASMPTVGVLWELHRKSTVASPTPQHSGPAGPTIQEQLCEYAALKLHALLKPIEYSMPWNYVYREWFDEAKKTPYNKDGKCAECLGVYVERLDGTKLCFTVDDMRTDTETYAIVMRSFNRSKNQHQQRVTSSESA